MIDFAGVETKQRQLVIDITGAMGYRLAFQGSLPPPIPQIFSGSGTAQHRLRQMLPQDAGFLERFRPVLPPFYPGSGTVSTYSWKLGSKGRRWVLVVAVTNRPDQRQASGKAAHE